MLEVTVLEVTEIKVAAGLGFTQLLEDTCILWLMVPLILKAYGAAYSNLQILNLSLSLSPSSL